MGYNQSCTFQNCTWKCCNYNGDCPQWYNNHQWQYTECYYYYGVDPTLLIWTAACTAVGAIIIIIVACYWYRDYKKRQEQLEKNNEQFEISNVTQQNAQGEVIVLGRNKDPVIGAIDQDGTRKGDQTSVPYGQSVHMNRTAIHGIGTIISKQL